MRKLLCVVPALLLASCHSQQVAFQFQPATTVAMPIAASPAAASPQVAAITAALPTATPAAPGIMPAPSSLKRLRPRQLATTLKSLPQSTLATLAASAQASSKLPQAIRRRHTTEGAAESGLGRVALFFIGVALAVVAGLAALLALIPGVSFWGGLGLAVAALVVLFLLYSLVSHKRAS